MNSSLDLYGDVLGPGALAGSYIIDQLAFQGGFAAVYRAHHMDTGDAVAIKVLLRELARSMNHVRRFRREAATLCELAHPHIVRVVGDKLDELSDGRPFITLEWLSGGTLRERLRKRDAFTASQVLAILEQVGSALAFAHERGVVHRDLKSQNILTEDTGDWFSCKLVDFGIAKITAPGIAMGAVTSHGVMGTTEVMAPEQLLGRAVDARTDIYALGVLTYQLLTGRMPFARPKNAVEHRASKDIRDRASLDTTEDPIDDALDIEDMHLCAPRPKPSRYSTVRPEIDRVVTRAMAVDPDERYASVREFLDELRSRVAETRGPTDRTPATPAAGQMAAVAIYMWMAPALDAPEQDIALDALEQACDALEQLGLEFALETAYAALAIMPLPDDRVASVDLRERILSAVATCMSEFVGDSPVLARAALRVGNALVTEGTQALDSPLLIVSEWPELARIAVPSGYLLADSAFARGLSLAGAPARDGYHYLSASEPMP